MKLSRIVDRTATVSQFIAAVLVAASAFRFGVAGFQSALDSTEANVPDAPKPHSSARPVAPREKNERSKRGRAKRNPSDPGGPSIRVTLGVTVGSERSEVFVNGRKVGLSPFLGDFSCKRGKKVKIEVVPPEAPLMVYERTCAPGTVRISEPPP